MGILRVPIEFLDEFKANPTDTARNFFSLAKGSQNPFFTDMKKVRDCVDYSLHNPFDDETMSFDSDFRATDSVPRYIHCDFGEVNNACFVAGTPILMDTGYFKNIEDISIGERVISHTSCSREVINTYIRSYSGDIIDFAFYGTIKISCTPEHPILAIKNNDIICNGYNGQWMKPDFEVCNNKCRLRRKGNFDKCDLRNNTSKYYTPKFVMASDLKIGDFVAIPKPTIKQRDSLFFNGKLYRMDSELGSLIGYYLAEGNSYLTYSGAGVRFSFHIKEKEYAEAVKNAIKKHFPSSSVSIQKRNRDNVRTVSATGHEIHDFLVYFCGRLSKNKHISRDILLYGNKEFHYSLLRSYFNGDGHLWKPNKNKQNSNGMASFTTISKRLADSVMLLFLAYGCIFRVYEEPEKEKVKKKYFGNMVEIHCSRSYKAYCVVNERISEILNVPYKRYDRKAPLHFFEYGNYIFVPIRKKEIRKFVGNVYNLRVHIDDSYVANFVAVHNCGISMTHIVNFKPIERIEIVSGKAVKTTINLPVLKFDFLGKISAPKGSRIYLDDIRELIFFELAYNRRFNIRLITFDGFQSSQILGELNRAGFPANRLSIDRTVSKIIVDFNNKETKTRRVSTEGMILSAWYSLKDAVNDGRLIVPPYQHFLEEAKYAEEIKGKKVESIIPSLSLDLLESMAGSIFNAINNEFDYPVIEQTNEEIMYDEEEARFYESLNTSDSDFYSTDNIFDEEDVWI